MKKFFYAAVKVNTANGAIFEGNQPFETDEPLTKLHLEKVKKLYCDHLRTQGVVCDPKNAVITAVIPLEA